MMKHLENFTRITTTLIMAFVLSGTVLIAQKSFQVEVGESAYDFTGTDQDGEELALSDYHGKYVLLNFTMTACRPCWKTYDQMNDAQAQYGNALKVISFHLDDARDMWDKMAKRYSIDFTCTSIWDAEEKSEIPEIYQVDGFPTYFLIDPEGIVVKKWFGNQKRKLKRNLKRHVQ